MVQSVNKDPTERVVKYPCRLLVPH
jgi:hypothetical protein